MPFASFRLQTSERPKEKKYVMPTKTGLLDHLYEYMSEDDWLDGLDFYKTGKIKKFEQHGYLLLGKCMDPLYGVMFDVRCKVHPSANLVQWFECTCKRNRIQSLYCSHIVALVLWLKDNQPKLFAKISTIAPARPPAKAMRRISKQLAETNKKESAASSMIDHLKSSFQKIEVDTKTGQLKITVSATGKKPSSYTLSVDQSANFLNGSFDRKIASPEVLALRVLDKPFEPLLIAQEDEEANLILEKGFACKLKRKIPKAWLENCSIEFLHEKLKVLPRAEKETHLIFPTQKLNYARDSKFLFIEGFGFIPVLTDLINDEWWETADKKTLKNDQAASTLNNNFDKYLAFSSVALSKSLEAVDIQILETIDKIDIKQNKGWFDLDPRYSKGGSSLSLVEILKKFKEKKQRYFRSGKKWVEVPEILTSYDWQLDPTGKYLRVNQIDLIRFKASVGSFDKVDGAKEALALLSNSESDPRAKDAPPLKHTKLDLRGYQTEGYHWLWWLYSNNLHGLLADDMGLGKTHQTMAVLSGIEKNRTGEDTNEHAKFLVICPTTVMMHWEDKISNFAPNLNPEVYHGNKRMYALNRLEEGTSTLITSYGILLRDIRQLKQVKWSAVVLDEAHFVKNSATSTYKAALELDADFRLCLTGTPMENKLTELKNIFDFLLPGYLGTNNFFKKQFGGYEDVSADPQKEVLLQRLIHPFKLRRMKEQVLNDLPSKQEDTLACLLTEDQAKMYKGILDLKGKPLLDALQDEDSKVSYMHVFTTLQLLKQICNHPALIENPSEYHKFKSGKFELLKELLTEAFGSDNKVVIFSQYLDMIGIISNYLKNEGIKHVTLTGTTRNRAEVIEQFQSDYDTKVFLGSLMAGGIGIDLTAASVVIHYDRWWNASKENQATDRVHRIGQKKFVQVYKLVTKGTLEEKIDLLIQKKQTMFTKFLERDEDIFKGMTRKDMLEMLQQT